MMKALVLSLAFLSFSLAAQGQSDRRLISVAGTAQKGVKPDLLSFSLEVWAKTAAAQRTQALAADETKRVMGILENYKIPKEEIQTESFHFGPDYVWDQNLNQNRLSGFSSTQVIRVRLRKTDQAGRLIDALTVAEKGDKGPRREFGTNVNQIQWDSSQRESLETEALTMAVKDARHKADVLAKAAGVKVKNLYRLSHQALVEPGPRPMMKMAMADSAAASTELAPGEMKVQVSVSADYEIQ